MLPTEYGMGDKGYIGHPKIVCPFKGDVQNLSAAQLAWNNSLNQRRTLVERTFGRMKEFSAVGDVWKHSLKLHPIVFCVCANLTNLKIQMQPL